MSAGGDPPEYSAAVKAAIDRGYMTMHPSGGYLSFTQAGAAGKSLAQTTDRRCKPKLTGHQRREALTRWEAGEVLTEIARSYARFHRDEFGDCGGDTGLIARTIGAHFPTAPPVAWPNRKLSSLRWIKSACHLPKLDSTLVSQFTASRAG